MHKALIISDSHGLEDELQEIRERHNDVDIAIHCGDSELSADSKFLDGYKIVKGNCDGNANFQEEIVVEFGSFKIYVTHGHLVDVKRSLLGLKYRAQERQADIVCYGHSHIAYAE
jgi:putative phosphoesterase